MVGARRLVIVAMFAARIFVLEIFHGEDGF